MGRSLDLPEGFTVDEEVPGLPPGFRLDPAPETAVAASGGEMAAGGDYPTDLPPGFKLDEAPTPPRPTAAAEAPSTPLSAYSTQFGKSFVQGAGGLVASVPKELAATGEDFTRRQLRAFERVDRGETVPEADDPVGYQQMSPEQRAQTKVQFLSATPASEQAATRVGTAIEQATTFPPEPGFEGTTWTGALGSGAGSMVAGMGTALIPGVGIPASGGAFILSGRQEARERAQKHGATSEFTTPEDIRSRSEQAAQLGSIAGATDVLDSVLPFLGTTGKALGFIGKVGATTVRNALLEGGQEGVQQLMQNAIAQGVYKPDQDLMEDVAFNAAVGAILGGVAGGAHGAIEGRQRPPLKVPTQNEMRGILDAISGAADASVGPEITTSGTMRWGLPEGYSAATIDAEQLPQALEPGQPWYYSPLIRAAKEKLPEAGTPEQIRATLTNAPGVKEEEVQYTRLDDFLASQGPRVTKADVVAHLEETQVRVQDVVHDFTEPRTVQGYEEYTLPGPRSGYREILLTLPEQPSPEKGPQGWGTTTGGTFDPINFRGPHFREPNVLAHIRLTDRVDNTGQSVLYVEEIQSDWHQAGQRGGYFKGPRPTINREALRKSEAGSQLTQELMKRHIDLHIVERVRRNIEAAQENKEFYTGREADFIGFMDQVERLYGAPARRAAESYAEAFSRAAAEREASLNQVPDAPFKTSWPELAIKRTLRWAADNGVRRIVFQSGEQAFQITTGGEGTAQQRQGLRQFYDQTVPSIAKKWAKKLGGSWGETLIQTQVRPNGIPSTANVVQLHDGQFAVQDETRRYGLFPTFEQAEVWRRGTAGTERAFYIDVPQRGATMVQSGLAVPQTVEPGNNVNVRIHRDIDRADPIFREVQAAVKIVKDIAKQFKIGAPIEIQLLPTVETHLGRQALGWMRVKADGRYVIQLNMDLVSNAVQAYTTLMHEFGHVLTFEKFNKLSATEQQAVRNAYQAYHDQIGPDETLGGLAQRRDNAVLQYLGLSGTSTKPLYSLDPEARKYWSGFDEWFAEQVARWATTDAKPLTIVEKIFSDFAKVLRLVMQVMHQKFGLGTFNASQAMTDWLNSFIDTTPPLTAPVYADLDLKTQRDNQTVMDAVDPGVPAPPRQGETEAGVNSVNNVFDGKPPREVRELAVHADKINVYLKYRAGIEQLMDLNPRFTPLLEYGERMREMHLETTVIMDATLRVGKAWRRLGTKQSDAVVGFMDDLTNMVYRTDDEVQRGVGRQPTDNEMLLLQRKHGVTPEGMRVVGRIRQMFSRFLTLMENNALAEAQRTITNPVALAAKIDGIRTQTKALRQRPYFPFMRFGRHYITVKNADGKVVHFETVERKGVLSAERVQRRREGELRRSFDNTHSFDVGLLPESTESFVGLPPLLLESIANEMQLTPLQRDALEQLRFEMSPAMSFRKRMMHKGYTEGYSMDFRRAFAKYFFHGARYYARTKYAWALRGHIRDAGAVGGLKAHKIRDYMQDHFEHNVIDARSDWGVLKGIAFQWILGFNVASAALNLTQVPMISGPFLGGKFGDLKATAALTKAYFNVKNFYRRETYKGLTEFEMKALDYGMKTGRISETQAIELAGMTQGNNLLSFTGGSKLREGFVKYLEWSAKAFETAEQINRRVTFRAALDLAKANPTAQVVKDAMNKHLDEYNNLRAKGWTEADARAVITAAYSVDQTQYVYSRYARPRFMRGPVSGALLVFFRYVESTLALLGSNKSDVLPRFIIMMMIMAGPYGVPGVEELSDLIRALAFRLFGKDFDPKREARKLILDLTNGTVPPDLLLHGLARYGFGIPAILDLLGGLATGRPGRGLTSPRHVEGQPQGFAQNVPMPVVDMSRAVGMGSIMRPNVGQLLMPGTDTNKLIAEQVRTSGGALVGSAIDIMKALRNTGNYSDFKNWERAIPRYLGNLAHSYRAFSEERERSRGGPQSAPTLLTYDVRDPEQMAEIIAMGLGFRPTRLNAQWDRVIMQNDVNQFYDIQRKELLEQAFEAKHSTDEKEWDKVMSAIKKFNTELPDDFAGKSITTKGKDSTLSRSMQSRERSRTAAETGIAVQKTRRGVDESIQRLFPESTVDVRRVR